MFPVKSEAIAEHFLYWYFCPRLLHYCQMKGSCSFNLNKKNFLNLTPGTWEVFGDKKIQESLGSYQKTNCVYERRIHITE